MSAPWRGMDLRVPAGPVTCGECATVHQADACPECGELPDGVLVGVLQTEVTTEAGARWQVTAERDPDTGGWAPVHLLPVAPGEWSHRPESETS